MQNQIDDQDIDAEEREAIRHLLTQAELTLEEAGYSSRFVYTLDNVLKVAELLQRNAK